MLLNGEPALPTETAEPPHKDSLMASPAKLVAAIADVLDVAESTVSNHDRNLAKAGLRTIGGRGTGAAQMTPRDATNLLLAVVGASNVKDSVVPVLRHGLLRTKDRDRWHLQFMTIPELTALPGTHTFADAVEALIRSAMVGGLRGELERRWDSVGPAIAFAQVNIEITMQEPAKLAGIKIYVADVYGKDGGYKPYDMHIEEKLYAIGDGKHGPKLDILGGDLRHLHIITQKAILAMGNLLAS